MKQMHLHNPFKPLLISVTILIFATVAFDPSFRSLLMFGNSFAGSPPVTPTPLVPTFPHVAIDILGQLTGADEPDYDNNEINNVPNSRGFDGPSDTAIDLIHHRLFTVDTGRHRVLVFDLDASNQLTDRIADHVLGQSDFRSFGNGLMTYPNDPEYDPANDRLFISDYSNNRVLVFDVATIEDGEDAVNVIGQPDFESGVANQGEAAPQADSLYQPGGVTLDVAGQRLFVNDPDNERVLVFDVDPSVLIPNDTGTDGPDAINVIGQPDFTTEGANTTAVGLWRPDRAAYDAVNQRLFVSDLLNNRITVYDVNPAVLIPGCGVACDGPAAINVIGQPDFITGDPATSQSGLNGPEGLSYDSVNDLLYASEINNNRVLVFDVDPTVLTPDVVPGTAEPGNDNPDAVNVIGQPDDADPYDSGDAGISQAALSGPSGTLLAGSSLFVTDTNNRRVMVFDVATISNGEDAVNLLGQLDENDDPMYSVNGIDNAPNAQGFEGPGGFALDEVHNRLFAVDYQNHRVLVFNRNSDGTMPDYTADFVLGQPDFKSTASGTTADTLFHPTRVSYDGCEISDCPADHDFLFVADSGNNRVLVYDTADIANGEDAIEVLGQTDFTSGGGGVGVSQFNSPQGVSIEPQNGILAVGDTGSNRVVLFDMDTTTGLPLDGDADKVFGQQDFDSDLPGASDSTMNNPVGVLVESNTDSLWVADLLNNRVLRFGLSDASGAPADNVLGQSDFDSSDGATSQNGMSGPIDVSLLESDGDDRKLFVSDGGNSRVLVFDISDDGGLVTDGEDAVDVYGQGAYDASDCSTSQTGLCNPNATEYDETLGYLFVADFGSNRIMVFGPPAPHTPTTAHLATDVIGQLDDAEQPLFTTDGTDNSPNRRGYGSPTSSTVDTVHHRLFVQDTGNGRVLVYDLDNSDHLIDRLPDRVLSLPDFKANGDELENTGFTDLAYDSTHNYLYGADWSGNRVLVFDVSTITGSDEPIHVLGKLNFDSDEIDCDTAPATAGNMCRPQGVEYDDVHQRLFVANQGQARVTVYDISDGIVDGEDAVNVLGQPNLTSATSAATQDGMGAGIKVVYDPTRDLLYVQDGHARVLQYDVETITNGEPAEHVLGQANFTTSVYILDDSTLGTNFNHSGLALDTTAQVLYVVDGGQNNRVMVWDVNAITDGEPAVHVLGQAVFTTNSAAGGATGMREPWGISFVADRLYVGDYFNYRVLVFDTTSLSDGMAATDMLGQLNPDDTPNFDAIKANNGPNWQGFDSPHGISLDEVHHRLFVADYNNHRVLVFNLNADNSPTDYTADFVIGQPDFKSYANPEADPQDNNLSGGPRTVFYDAEHDRLYVDDLNGSRVLIYDTSDISNGMSATWVLGKPNFTTGGCCDTSDHEFHGAEGLALDADTELLYVTDGFHNRVLVFDVATIANGESAVHVLGQPNFLTLDEGTGPSGMNGPRGVAVDPAGQRLFVSEAGNRRILVFDLSDGIDDGEDAVNVLGQTDFTSLVVATSQSTIPDPSGLFYDSSGDRLFVSEPSSSRVLVFDVASITDGENAVDAYGQPTFNGSDCITTQSGLCIPYGVYYDETHQTLYVGDGGNNRVMIFGPVAPTPTPGGGGGPSGTPTPTPVVIRPEGIVINDDDTSTDSRNVLVTVSARWSNSFNGTIDVLLSNDSDFSTYVPFRFNINDAVADRADWPKIIAWDLCWGLPNNTVCNPGTKTVYARFYTNVPLPKPALTPAP